jgi:hypothetical protein
MHQPCLRTTPVAKIWKNTLSLLHCYEIMKEHFTSACTSGKVMKEHFTSAPAKLWIISAPLLAKYERTLHLCRSLHQSVAKNTSPSRLCTKTMKEHFASKPVAKHWLHMYLVCLHRCRFALSHAASFSQDSQAEDGSMGLLKRNLQLICSGKTEYLS